MSNPSFGWYAEKAEGEFKELSELRIDPIEKALVGIGFALLALAKAVQSRED